MATQTGSIDLKGSHTAYNSSIQALNNAIDLRVEAEEQIGDRIGDAEAAISLKIDRITDSGDLLSNINAIADQISLMASQINFGANTVAENLNDLNSAVSIDTANSIITVGTGSAFHVQISPTELGFYQGGTRVAYINGNRLYITQSVVLQQMDVGTPVNDGGLGQWSWKIHPNGQNPSRNNLNLKWVG